MSIPDNNCEGAGPGGLTKHGDVLPMSHCCGSCPKKENDDDDTRGPDLRKLD